VVVSNHVIEHVANQQLHFDEICRMLKPGGTLYLATPNKWWWRENHFKLPLLGWLPRPLGQRYVKLVRGRDWDVYPLSLGAIHRLNRRRLTARPQTANLLKQPAKLRLSVPKPVTVLARLLPDAWLNKLTGLLPTFIIIFVKPK
jgi:SAM-dependent methyltransferase